MTCHSAPAPQTILIVDDLLDNLRVLSATLTKQGYKVRCAKSGSMALLAAQSAPPDLILLYIKMPHMNGYEVCEKLRADDRTCEIPVIFLSALDEVLDQVTAFEAGGVDYITKPFQVQVVLARVKNHLALQAAKTEIRQLNAQLEQKVQQRTAQLEQEIVERQKLNQELLRSNAELEQFAYVASHDLREPLRKIKSYVELLAERYPQADDKTSKYITYVVGGVTRMQQLISDLLSYSRVGRAEQCFQPTDLNTVIEKVLDNLELAIAEKHAQITVDPLPTISAHPVQMVQLFQNLIANSLKFHGETAPVIEVKAQYQDQWLISVSDRGIGIAAQYAQRVFAVFQTLHSRSQYDGSGIGLAICKKIVECHGGKIWFDSELGKGTTFYLTLSADMNRGVEIPPSSYYRQEQINSEVSTIQN